MMDEALEAWIQTVRKRSGLSVEKAARQAGIAPSTLRRWENGVTQPRLPELNALLDTLRTSEADRETALRFLTLPRALAAQRELAAKTDPLRDALPVTGELWRALRLRSGLTQQQVADHLRLSQNAVASWEQSRCAPAADHLNALCALLQAHPEERTVLENLRLVAEPTSFVSANALLEASEQELSALQREGEKDLPLADLRYLALEARLWPPAVHYDSALRLLAKVWLLHADYLLWRGQMTEVCRYTDRLLNVVEHHFGAEWICVEAVCRKAQALAHASRHPNPAAALELLSRWSEFAAQHGDAIGVYRDMAEMAGTLGQPARAQTYIQHSRLEADRLENAEAVQLASLIEGRLLKQAGQPDKAIRRLAQEEGIQPRYRAISLLQCAEAAEAMGDRSAACAWLQSFYVVIEQHEIRHLRWQADGLAHRL